MADIVIVDSASGDIKAASRTSIQVKLPSADQTARRSPQDRSRLTVTRSTDSRHFTQLPSPELGYSSGEPSSQFSKLRIQQDKENLRIKGIHQTAACKIESAWLAFRNKQMFRLLKHSVCAAESSLSSEILRKVCPREAGLLYDKTFQIKVRFRFGGAEFPPVIFFKIFNHTDGGHAVKYISGRRMIRPASEAAEDSVRMMGNRQFYDQMVVDALRHKQAAITDETDVTTLKDYMQYLSNLDETPANLGGRENHWRQLTLNDLPRQTIFYDVVDFAYNHRLSPHLRSEMAILLTHPVTQEVQVQHIKSIAKIRAPSMPIVPPEHAAKTKATGSHSQPSSRRSRQARSRALKMRRLYGSGEQSAGGEPLGTDTYHFPNLAITEEDVETEDEMDGEASRLYEWTQSLGLSDDFTATPRPLPAH